MEAGRTNLDRSGYTICVRSRIAGKSVGATHQSRRVNIRRPEEGRNEETRGILSASV